MRGVTGFEHIAIRASDVEAMVRFYTESLGLAEMTRLFTDEGDLRLVYIRLTDTQCLEIFPGAASEAPGAAHRAGVFHIGLAVENMDETVADLTSRGVTTTPITVGKSDHNRHAWVVDPEGNRFELMEMSATSLQRQAIARLRGEQKEGETNADAE